MLAHASHDEACAQAGARPWARVSQAWVQGFPGSPGCAGVRNQMFRSRVFLVLVAWFFSAHASTRTGRLNAGREISGGVRVKLS